MSSENVVVEEEKMNLNVFFHTLNWELLETSKSSSSHIFQSKIFYDSNTNTNINPNIEPNLNTNIIEQNDNHDDDSKNEILYNFYEKILTKKKNSFSVNESFSFVLNVNHMINVIHKSNNNSISKNANFFIKIEIIVEERNDDDIWENVKIVEGIKIDYLNESKNGKIQIDINMKKLYNEMYGDMMYIVNLRRIFFNFLYMVKDDEKDEKENVVYHEMIKNPIYIYRDDELLQKESSHPNPSDFQKKNFGFQDIIHELKRYEKLNDIETIASMLKDKKDENGYDLLIHSCYRGYENIVKYLVDEKEYDIFQKDDNDNSVFYWCIKNKKYINILEFLIKRIEKYKDYEEELMLFKNENEFLTIKNSENIRIKEKLVIENIQNKDKIAKFTLGYDEVINENESLKKKLETMKKVVNGNSGDKTNYAKNDLQVVELEEKIEMLMENNQTLLKENTTLVLQKHQKVKKIEKLLKETSKFRNEVVNLKMKLGFQTRKTQELEKQVDNKVENDKYLLNKEKESTKYKQVGLSLMNILSKIYDV